MKVRLLAPLVFLLAACNSSQKSSETIADSAGVDTSGLTADLADSSVIAPVYSYVLNDSAWKASSLRVLRTKEVKKLFVPVKDVSDARLDFYLNRYFELDSMNRGLKEKDFDIGQIVSTSVKFMDTLSANMEYTLCSWILEYGSYEACPYYNATLCMISTFDPNGKVISTACVAEEGGGGDPPAWGSTSKNVRVFSDGKLLIRKTERSGEDEKGTETVSAQEGVIESNGIIKLLPYKEISSREITAREQ